MLCDEPSLASPSRFVEHRRLILESGPCGPPEVTSAANYGRQVGWCMAARIVGLRCTFTNLEGGQLNRSVELQPTAVAPALAPAPSSARWETAIVLSGYHLDEAAPTHNSNGDELRYPRHHAWQQEYPVDARSGGF